MHIHVLLQASKYEWIINHCKHIILRQHSNNDDFWLDYIVMKVKANHTLWEAYCSKLDSTSVSDSSVRSPALFSRLDDIVKGSPLCSDLLEASVPSTPFPWLWFSFSSLLMIWSTSVGKVWIRAAFSSGVSLSTTTSTKFCLVHPYTIALKNPCNGSVNDCK